MIYLGSKFCYPLKIGVIITYLKSSLKLLKEFLIINYCALILRGWVRDYLIFMCGEDLFLACIYLG